MPFGKKQVPCILKYMACILKYVPCIFSHVPKHVFLHSLLQCYMQQILNFRRKSSIAHALEKRCEKRKIKTSSSRVLRNRIAISLNCQ